MVKVDRRRPRAMPPRLTGAVPSKGLKDQVGDGVADLAGAPGRAISGAVAKGFEAVAESFAEGAAKLLQETSAAWTRIPWTSATQNEATLLVQQDLKALTAFVSVVALVIALSRLALKRRAEELPMSMIGLLRVMVVGSAGLWLVTQLLDLGDEFSRWIINESSSNGISTGAGAVLTGGGIGSAGLLFLIALLAILTSIIQIALLVMRGGVLVVLAGAWQLSAAATVAGEAGSGMWRKTTAWLAAFVLYKPAAAICYAAGYRLMSAESSTGGEALAAIQGLLLLILAILALPAMIRLTVPAAAMAGPSTAGMLAGGAAVASGAVMLAGGTGAASGVIGNGSSGFGGGPSGAVSSGGSSGSSGSPTGGSSGSSGSSSGGGSSGGGRSGSSGSSTGTSGSSGASSGSSPGGSSGDRSGSGGAPAAASGAQHSDSSSTSGGEVARGAAMSAGATPAASGATSDGSSDQGGGASQSAPGAVEGRGDPAASGSPGSASGAAGASDASPPPVSSTAAPGAAPVSGGAEGGPPGRGWSSSVASGSRAADQAAESVSDVGEDDEQ